MWIDHVTMSPERMSMISLLPNSRSYPHMPHAHTLTFQHPHTHTPSHPHTHSQHLEATAAPLLSNGAGVGVGDG